MNRLAAGGLRSTGSEGRQFSSSTQDEILLTSPVFGQSSRRVSSVQGFVSAQHMCLEFPVRCTKVGTPSSPVHPFGLLWHFFLKSAVDSPHPWKLVLFFKKATNDAVERLVLLTPWGFPGVSGVS